jgi:ABC-type nitrate/sulfonate/bicarbonate transport system substrate-binding protein
VNSLLRYAAVAVFAALLSGLPAHAEHIKVTYPNLNGSYIYFFTAIDNGYYKDEGFDLEVLESGGGTATAALLSGDIQFSTSGSSAISAILKGAKLKVLLVGEDRPDWQVWTTKPEIKTFDDLKEQQIGVVSRGDTGEIGIRYYLMKRGLPNDFVAFTPMGSSLGTRMAMVKSGALPAALLHPGDVEVLRNAGGLDHGMMLADLRQEVRSTFNGLATSDDLIKNHPDMVERFVRATRKGMIYARNNRDESIARFAGYMKAKPEEMSGEYDLLRTLMAVDGTIGTDVQDNEIALRGAMMDIPKDQLLTRTGVFNFDFAQRVNTELASKGWTPNP